MPEQFWYVDARGVPQSLHDIEAVLAARRMGLIADDHLLFDPTVGAWKPAHESPQLVRALADVRRHNPWRFVGATLRPRTNWLISLAMIVAASVLLYRGPARQDGSSLWAVLLAVSLAVVMTALRLSLWERSARHLALMQLWVAGIILVVAAFISFG